MNIVSGKSNEMLGVQTSSTHLLFWVERIGFQPRLGHGVVTLGKKLYSHHHTFFHPVL